jgi:hypothetical protein
MEISDKYSEDFISKFNMDNPEELFKRMDHIGSVMTNGKSTGEYIFQFGSCYQLLKVMDFFFKNQVKVLLNKEENHVIGLYIDEKGEEHKIGYDDNYPQSKSEYTNYGTVDEFEKASSYLANNLSSKPDLRYEQIIDEINRIIEYKNSLKIRK